RQPPRRDLVARARLDRNGRRDPEPTGTQAGTRDADLLVRRHGPEGARVQGRHQEAVADRQLPGHRGRARADVRGTGGGAAAGDQRVLVRGAATAVGTWVRSVRAVRTAAWRLRPV